MTDREWCIYKCFNQEIILNEDDLYNFCERVAIMACNEHITFSCARKLAFNIVFGVEVK